MVADLSHLPDEVVYALRHGKLPPSLADPQAELQESEDAERFRKRFHALVDQGLAGWLDENPDYGNRVPADVKARIEDDCRRRIQHEWRNFVQERGDLDEEDDDEYGNPW